MTRTPVADWQHLSELYEAADALEPRALADWLTRLEQQAHPMLPQLRQMLEARSQIRDNGFLDALPHVPTTPASAPQAIEWHGGSRIGPYRLAQKIGSGGMAEVWLAHRDDGAFQRQVAIKLLFRHAGSSQRDTFAQRFDRERDILASLNHPHIAGLHDAGVTPSGQPWLALEYVEGQTLTTWCDTHRLAIEARVRLFRQVLLAVQHAHANLVIHRDLKPGNILVTAEGGVRLLDFGIAKLMEPAGAASVETELTRMAGRPMTPQYAAPEQLLGQPLTTACDVYSLGVVLYELLCGERPYELKVESAAQLEDAILEIEPRPPSRRALDELTAMARGTTSVLLRKHLGSDLDAIVLRALAKQPAQRYGSVEAMGADLDRWIAGEPVEARAPSTVYRVGKFVRRHVLSVSLGVGAVVALASVAAIAVVMGLQAREDSARAVAARDFMLNIFSRANQEKSRGADITARDLLETGRKDILTALADQPELQAELLRGIAKIQGDMGEYGSADTTFAVLTRIYGALDKPREQSKAMADHAYNAVQMNNLALADRLLQSAQAVDRRLRFDAESNARIGEVAGWIALNGGDVQRAQGILAEHREAALKQLGPNHLRTFKLGQVLFRVERDLGNTDAALFIQDELRRSAPGVQGLDRAEASVMDWEQVSLLYGAGRFAQALTFVQTSLPKCVIALGPQEQNCRLMVLKKGQILLRLGEVGQAKQMLPELEAMAGDATWPFVQTEALFLQLRLRSIDGDAAAVGPLFERVQAFGESGAQVTMPVTFKAAALLVLAESRLRTGDATGAERWASAALSLFGTETPRAGSLRMTAIARMLIGIALLQQGKADEAMAWLDRSQGEFTKVLGSSHPTTLLFGLNRALVLAEQNRVAEARLLVRAAAPALREALGHGSSTYKAVDRLVDQLDNRAAHVSSGDADTGSQPALRHPSWGREFFS